MMDSMLRCWGLPNKEKWMVISLYDCFYLPLFSARPYCQVRPRFIIKPFSEDSLTIVSSRNMAGYLCGADTLIALKKFDTTFD